ncbi:MAG: hypothetical protein HRF40_11100 [Nitrososphaera sp.]|jgi:hypothetical protein
MLSDEELLAKYSELPAIRYFLDKYPDAKAEVDRTPHEQYFVILFTAERQVSPQRGFNSGVHSLGISVLTTPFQPSLYVTCGLGGMSTDQAVESIETIDNTEKWCFQPTPPFYSGGLDDGHEENEIDMLTFGNSFDFNFRKMKLTVAVNAVGGSNLGLRQPIELEPEVIAEYPLLQAMIEEADKAGTEELVIIHRNISGIEADFLTDGRLAFVQTCFELVCYDEVSSFINLGSESNYIIRVYEADNSDPFAPDDDNSNDETGVFEIETDVGEPIPVEVSVDNGTSIEIIYNED